MRTARLLRPSDYAECCPVCGHWGGRGAKDVWLDGVDLAPGEPRFQATHVQCEAELDRRNVARWRNTMSGLPLPARASEFWRR